LTHKSFHENEKRPWQEDKKSTGGPSALNSTSRIKTKAGENKEWQKIPEVFRGRRAKKSKKKGIDDTESPHRLKKNV